MTSVSDADAIVPCSPKQALGRRSPLDAGLQAELFKALSDPTRLKLLACVVKCGRPASVTEVAECCEVDFSVVARHLGTLSRAGLLHAEKRGRSVLYHAHAEQLADRFQSLADAFRSSVPSSGGCPPDCCASPPPHRRTA